MNGILYNVRRIGRSLGRLIRDQNGRGDKNVAPRVFDEKDLEEVAKQVKIPLPTDSELKRVEIIMLKYRAPEMESVSVQRLIENTEWPYKLTLYDNRPGTKNMSKIWNRLVKESTCDFIVIMDSDVFVPSLHPCWLTRLMDTFEKRQDCLVVSPRVTRTSSVQQAGSVAGDPEPVEFDEIFANMCVLYKKEAFDRVGYFDEEFLIYGADSEWAHRCLGLGIAYLRPDVVVNHIKHYSVKKEEKGTGDFMQFEREYARRLYDAKTKK